MVANLGSALRIGEVILEALVFIKCHSLGTPGCGIRMGSLLLNLVCGLMLRGLLFLLFCEFMTINCWSYAFLYYLLALEVFELDLAEILLSIILCKLITL